MSFTSLEFLLFMTLCLAALRSTRRISAQTWLIIAFSYVFYLSFGAIGLAVITLTALAGFYVGRHLGPTANNESRHRWLWAGVLLNLGPLACFKYSGFVAESIGALLQPIGVQLSVSHDPLLSVVGLSYFSFSGMSYILDIYYDKIEPSESLREYLCYLVYFPKLVAGPIVRAGELLPQLRKSIQFSAQDFEIGCAYLLVGAVKKLVIADQLSSHVSMIMAAPQHYNALTLFQGLVGYTVQIYADFSGYSDMAIGCARIMGIKLPQNFLMPYSSVNIAEFWRRWHVTMSVWFRDYVFIPLEIRSRSMRSANVRVARNMIITMLLCGLWHGASWNFVFWGGVHGIALSTYLVYSSLRGRQRLRAKKSAFHPATLAARILTLSVVMLGYIFFGTHSLALAFTYMWRIMYWANDGVTLGSPYILPLTALVLLAHLIINKDRNLIEEVSNFSIPVRVFAYAGMLLALTSLVPSEAVPFVYVHF